MSTDDPIARAEALRSTLAAVQGEPSACWTWPGAITSEGYGTTTVAGRTTSAHRAIYQLVNGAIPAGLEIDHVCRNRACINPGHLQAVMRRENILRGTSPTAINARKLVCKRGHPFDETNTYRLPGGGRECWTCKRAKLRAERKANAHPKVRPTACIHGHAFTPENTSTDKHGRRKCRACHNRRSAARRRRKSGTA